MATTTLTEARQLLSDIVGDLVVGQASGDGGAGGSTIVDTALQALSFNQDDLYNNQVAFIYETTDGAAPLGEEAHISDFVASGGTLTLYGTGFTATVNTNDRYEIHKIWTPTEKRRALNWAIRRGYPKVARNIIDEQITTVANIWSYRLGDFGTGGNVTYTSTSLTDTDKAWIANQFAGYRVESGAYSTTVTSNTATVLTTPAWSPTTKPTDEDSYTIIHPIEGIYDVEVQINTDTATYPFKSYPFGTREHEGTRTIQFGPGARPPDSRTVRLIGRGYLSDFTSTESSVVEIEERHIDALIFLAAHFLFRRTPMLSASQDREFYREEAARYLAMWEIEKKKLAVRSFPVKLWSSQMTVHRGGDQLSELALFDTPNPP